MSTQPESVLVVVNDPEVSDLISSQTLKPLGYSVVIANNVSDAIKTAVETVPDVILTKLDLPGLSGKDLLAALSSQGVGSPVIVVAEEGMEGDVIQAFRLGASDYLNWPIREAEVVSAVERAMKTSRARREREQLAKKLEIANKSLQNRVRELTTIFAIGKAVTSITDQRLLFEKIVDGAVYVADADRGWFLVRKGDPKHFILRAYRNLPRSITRRINKIWDDGISNLVALSGESLSIHGEPLQRFKISQFGNSIMIVPVKIKDEVAGLLVVVREDPIPFNKSNKTMLEALADYASISLVNSRLFKVLEQRALSLQKAVAQAQEFERSKSQVIQNVAKELEEPVKVIRGSLNSCSDETQELGKAQTDAIAIIEDKADHIEKVIEAMLSLQYSVAPKQLTTASLTDLAERAVVNARKAARERKIEIQSELPLEPIFAFVDSSNISRVFDVLISNAIRFSPEGANIVLQVEKRPDGTPLVSVQDSGPGIKNDQKSKIFDPFYKFDNVNDGSISDLGIGLPLAKEIVKAHGGELWVESKTGVGSVFFFTIQSPEREGSAGAFTDV